MIPLNIQPIEKRDHNTDGSLSVVDIWLTIQGEGPFAGRPAVFIRTAGCPLDCPLCDTNYTLGRITYTAQELVEKVQELWSQPLFCRDKPLVVITGGEPLRQNLDPLIRRLIGRGYHVQIETNGVYPWDMSWKDQTVVCSPKTGKIHDGLKPYVSALKYVVRAGAVDPIDGLPTSVLGNGVVPAKPWESYRGPIYVQPCDDADSVQNALNMKAAVDSCMKFGFTLCLQMHKIAGLP